MPCERCEECRVNGERFCRYCGEQIADEYTATCPYCEECRVNGMTYCTGCGKCLKEQKSQAMHIITILGLISTALLTCLLLFETGVMLWGVPNVLNFLTDYSSSLILVVPAIIDIATLSGLPLKIYYILLVIAVLACMAYALYRSIEPAKELIKGNTEKMENSALFEICVLFAALYAVEFVIILIANPSDVVSFESKWESMFQLLEAPVWEEIVTRILYLGLPVLIVYSIRKMKDKPFWHYLLGGWNRFDLTTLIFILFSATMFGLGHVMGSWGAWKFIPTFLFGLIAGYLFVKYGVYATILIHFLTDYITSEEYLTGSPIVFTALIIVGTLFMCIPYVWIYSKRGFNCARSIIKDRSKY